MQLLGIREPDIYGTQSYKALVSMICSECEKEGIEVSVLQSNHEGQLVDWIDEAYGKADGIIINPAAYTHTSIAIRDAILAVQLPVVEVHLSDTGKREPFRKQNYIRDICSATFEGEGFESYRKAIQYLKKQPVG